MHVQYVALCEQMILGGDGRPSLINVLADLTTAAVPVTIPRLVFAARLLLTADETGRGYRIDVAITDPSGAELGRPGGDVDIPRAPAEMESVAVDLPLTLDLFQVTALGRYTFVLHIDGEARSAAQLAVRQGTVHA